MFQTFDKSASSDTAAGRVRALRALLNQRAFDALIVPRADEHQGEYVPPSAERLAWLTGFTGSAGLAVVARRSAALFVDGRYTVQARAEVDSDIFELPDLPRNRMSEWLIPKLGKAAVVGFNPWLHTVNEIESWRTQLAARGVKLQPTSRNLVDQIWGKERPEAPVHRIIPHPLKLAGRAATEKIADVQAALKADGHDAVVLTLPDSIMWLLNIRGSDVAHNPVALVFAVVPATGKPELYAHPDKLDREVRAHLDGAVKISPPEALKVRLKTLKDAGKKVRLDPNTAAWGFAKALGGPARIAKAADPCIALKARKNDTEIKGAKAAHVRDGVAMVRFLAWLDREAACGVTLDEIATVARLEECRRETGQLREISFDTISGSGPNGAIVHYRVSTATNRQLKPGELFLIDSGGQYADGTTDITRTVAIGEPSAEMRERFTLVLKGHIAIATARFPKGTRGIDLDPFARRALWDRGFDYDHGTGHGIGSYLSVHEGPQSISRAGMAVLEPGMLCSNEPGYYKEGAYGIRIENVVVVTAPEKPPNGDKPVMAFETITLCPIDLRLVVSSLLTPTEIAWLDGYHARVRETLTPLLADAGDRAWLAAATKAIA